MDCRLIENLPEYYEMQVVEPPEEYWSRIIKAAIEGSVKGTMELIGGVDPEK